MILKCLSNKHVIFYFIGTLTVVFALCHGNQGCGLQFVINSFMRYLYMR